MRNIYKSSAALVATAALGASFAVATAGTAQAAPSCNTVAQCAAGSQPTLKIGKRNGDVKRLQRSLTKAGFKVPATGYFGTMTRSALIRYQRANGVPATGTAATLTWTALQGGKAAAPRAAAAVAPRAAAAPAPAPAAAPASGRAGAAVSFALAQQGKPYGYGATGPGAYDCSGLTMAAMRSAGISVPRTSQAQAAGGRTVSLSQAQPGDLVIYYGGASHVGMYIGNGKIVHSSRPGKPVSVVSVTSMPVNKVVRYA
ncbi:C40 family peptidase [Mariniluteicoccus flavus]